MMDVIEAWHVLLGGATAIAGLIWQIRGIARNEKKDSDAVTKWRSSVDNRIKNLDERLERHEGDDRENIREIKQTLRDIQGELKTGLREVRDEFRRVYDRVDGNRARH